MKMDAEQKVVGKKRKWDEPLDNQNKIQCMEEGTQICETVNEGKLDEPMSILTLSENANRTGDEMKIAITIESVRSKVLEVKGDKSTADESNLHQIFSQIKLQGNGSMQHQQLRKLTSGRTILKQHWYSPLNKSRLDACLLEIDKHLRKSGKSLNDYPNMPIPDCDPSAVMCNTLIAEQLDFNRQALAEEFETLQQSMTDEQKNAFQQIFQAIETKQDLLINITLKDSNYC
ncbi:hypothetical protein RIF29_24905 [Crotalaria pallida]|uniref:Uncharacterized protein n=1 Tax=Crotalaria pallida TaxID=3830 RepID=A0AAN9I3P5_CROPI